MANTIKVAELPNRGTSNRTSIDKILSFSGDTLINLLTKNTVFVYRGQVANCADAKEFGVYTIASTATDLPPDLPGKNASDLLFCFAFKEGYYPLIYLSHPMGFMWICQDHFTYRGSWKQFPVAHPTASE